MKLSIYFFTIFVCSNLVNGKGPKWLQKFTEKAAKNFHANARPAKIPNWGPLDPRWKSFGEVLGETRVIDLAAPDSGLDSNEFEVGLDGRPLPRKIQKNGLASVSPHSKWLRNYPNFQKFRENAESSVVFENAYASAEKWPEKLEKEHNSFVTCIGCSIITNAKPDRPKLELSSMVTDNAYATAKIGRPINWSKNPRKLPKMPTKFRKLPNKFSQFADYGYNYEVKPCANSNCGSSDEDTDLIYLGVDDKVELGQIFNYPK